jgi:hypothetical protein
VRSRLRELAGIAAGAVVLTAVIAAPVIRAPSELLFGHETVGRHHDPFTVMRLFEHPPLRGPYAQPVTELAGAAISRVTGPAAAYNWLVLLTFPSAAMAAFLLGRYLGLSLPAAAFAALAFAFSPFHLAQSAYHPHIAQVQWVPLYFLLLWRALDRATPARLAALLLACVCVTFSNFYGGLIATVMTPFAAGALWLSRRRDAGAARRLMITSGTLLCAAAAGFAFVWATTPALIRDPAAFAAPPADAFRYSAKLWSYVIPPVVNPWVGRFASDVWAARGEGLGLLEQQVTIGAGVLLLCIVGGVAAWRHRASSASGWAIPMLAGVATIAVVFSLAPTVTFAGVTFALPSGMIVALLPMFRSFARFGVVVQLMAVLLAACGAEALWRMGRAARATCVALVLLVAGEYAVAPSAMSRDMLPTSAHRWLMAQPGRVRALDCTVFTPESESVQWLSDNRIVIAGGTLDDCLEPRFAEKLAALGYTHLIVRADSASGNWLLRHTPNDLVPVKAAPGAAVLAIAASPPAIYTESLSGFDRREADAAWTWRWTGHDAAWTIVNTRTDAVTASLELELTAFHHTRDVTIRFDGRDVRTLSIAPERGTYVVSITVPPGRHALAFYPRQPPSVADALVHNRDPRPLSFALGDWRWSVRRNSP